MTTSLRQLNRVALLGVAVLLAGCTAVAVKAKAPGPMTTTTAASPSVRWLDEPASSALLSALLPKPVPLTPPRTGAPASSASATKIE